MAEVRGLGLGALLGALVLASSTGCSFMARDTASYERDTSALLDTRAAEIEACYDAELARNPKLSGTLTLTFTVEKQTGKLIRLSWDKNRSTVSEALAVCVSTALAGLKLSEPDRRDGEATFRYRFAGRPSAGE